MGPNERQALVDVAAHVWPGVKVSERLARGLILYARQVDSGTGIAELLSAYTGMLRDCPQQPGKIHELQANGVARAAGLPIPHEPDRDRCFCGPCQMQRSKDRGIPP